MCAQVRERIAEQWRLQRAAELAKLNTSHFSELFHREIGLSFRAYVERIRIDYAKNLLVDTRMQISQIADVIGYRDIGTFERAFKRQESMGPRAYRNRVLHVADGMVHQRPHIPGIEKSPKSRSSAENSR